MSEKHPSEQVAVVCDRSSDDVAAVRDFLQAQDAGQARWYERGEVGDVDKGVCAGRFKRVVFAAWGDLLEGIWSGDIAFDQWLARDVTIDCLQGYEPDPQACTQAVFHHWQAYRRRHRNRQVIAGVILSAVAVVAAFILNFV